MKDYIKSKKRIYGILSDNTEIKKVNKIDNLKERLHVSNGVKSWVTSVFVDISSAQSIFNMDDNILKSKIFRSYSSETLDILYNKEDIIPIEAGVQGDVVYAIYSTPFKKEIYKVFNIVCEINSMIHMLNKILTNKGYINIKVNIGVESAEDLIINATTLSSDLTDKLILGNSIKTAKNLSKVKSDNSLKLGNIFYFNIIDTLKENNKNKPVESWFVERDNYYEASIINTTFYDWINDGMKEI